MKTDLLGWLGQTRLSAVIAESPTIFPWLEVIHVIGIGAMVGTIMIVDLRLVGLAGRDYAVSRLSRTLLPITWAGFLIALASGVLMFSSQPEMYWGNWYFRAKMVLLLLAGINMAVFHLLTARSMAGWDLHGAIPSAARAAGLASLTIWILAIAAGRWIGFTMTPF